MPHVVSKDFFSDFMSFFNAKIQLIFYFKKRSAEIAFVQHEVELVMLMLNHWISKCKILNTFIQNLNFQPKNFKNEKRVKLADKLKLTVESEGAVTASLHVSVFA